MNHPKNALSLFNGMSGLFIALKEMGVNIGNYFVSETDKYANQAAKALNKESIFLGDVHNVTYKNGILGTKENGLSIGYKCKIDILTAGFPCQDFSIMGNRLNFEGERGKLFFEFLRIYRAILKENPNVIVLGENVKMAKYIKEAISQELGFRCVQICSSLLSAQSRGRLYWTNISPGNVDLFGIVSPSILQPKDRKIKLLDILETDVPEKYYLKESTAKAVLSRLDPGFTSICLEKSKVLLVGDFKAGNRGSFILQRAHGFKNLSMFTDKCPTITSKSWQQNNFVAEKDENGKLILDGYRLRRLTVRECFKLQNIPGWAIEILLDCGISDSQLYKMIGNGWENGTIMYILSHEKRLFE